MRVISFRTKVIAMALSVVAFFVAVAPTQGATATAAEASEQQMTPEEYQARIALIEKKRQQLDASRPKTVTIKNVGWYHAKNIKIYGRYVRWVDLNGEFFLSEWEQLENTMTLNGFVDDSVSFEVSGHVLELAFSFDVTGGTDYPYSGVFWNDHDNMNTGDIKINLGGTCRMADITIDVGNKRVVNETNCSSHKEWQPPIFYPGYVQKY